MSEPQKRLTVAVTGAAGYVAGRLIESLEHEERVERVLGFDVRAPATTPSKLVFDEVDVRDPRLEARLDGVDALVHLAFVMDPIEDEALMRDINVAGSDNVFACAGRAGVGKIVYTSSATVYGAHPDNDFPLTEASPLRANFDFSYATHKLEVEYVVREFRESFPSVCFTVFRPAIVFGPRSDSAWSHMLELPALFSMRGYRPPLQFVHEDDVAHALRFALFEDLDGAFNLAPADWLEHEHVLEIVGKRVANVSERRAYSLLSRMWDAGLSEIPPGIVHYLMYPWVLSAQKLTARGFRTSASAEQALRDAVAATRGFVRLGKHRVRRKHLLRGAVAGAGLVGATAAWRGARREREAA